MYSVFRENPNKRTVKIDAVRGILKGKKFAGKTQAETIMRKYMKGAVGTIFEVTVAIDNPEVEDEYVPHTFLLIKAREGIQRAYYISRDGLEEETYLGYDYLDELKKMLNVVFVPEEPELCSAMNLDRDKNKGSIERMFACATYISGWLGRRMRFTPSHLAAYEAAGGKKWED